MSSDPVIILSGTNEPFTPSNPVRIVNWSDLVQAIVDEITDGGVIFDYIRFNTDVIVPAFSPGTVYWNKNDATIEGQQDNTGGEEVSETYGYETKVRVRNDTGVDWPNGRIIYPVGSVGFRPTAALARADAIDTCRARGITTQAIAKNKEGFACTFGPTHMDTSMWNESDWLYLSATVDGGLQTTPPTSGFTLPVGYVLRKSPDPNLGLIFFSPYPTPAFGDLVGGHYTQFDYNGTMRSVGDATCWKDELGPFAGTRIYSPASDFEWSDADIAINAKATARYPTDLISSSNQFNHDMPPGTVVRPHLHWKVPSAAMAAATPNFLIAFRWQIQGAPSTTAWTLRKWQTHAFTPTTYPFNQITAFGDITPPVGYGQVSDRLEIHFYRDVTNVSTLFTGPEGAPVDVLMTDLDTHRRTDGLGSDEEYIR